MYKAPPKHLLLQDRELGRSGEECYSKGQGILLMRTHVRKWDACRRPKAEMCSIWVGVSLSQKAA